MDNRYLLLLNITSTGTVLITVLFRAFCFLFVRYGIRYRTVSQAFSIVIHKLR
jgi:hypothetical protein